MSYPQVFIMGVNVMFVPKRSQKKDVKTLRAENDVKEALEIVFEQHKNALLSVHGLNPAQLSVSANPEKLVEFHKDLKSLHEQHVGFLNLDRTLRETINLLAGNNTIGAMQYRAHLVNVQEKMINAAGKRYDKGYKALESNLRRSIALAGLDFQKFKEPLTTGRVGGKDFYQDTEFQASFMKFLNKEYSAENGNFLLDLYNLQNNTTDSLAIKAKKLDDIFTQYIPSDAKNQVNLSSPNLANLMEAKNSPAGLSLSSFNAAVDEVERMMSKDTYSRFLKEAKPEKSGLQAVRGKIKDIMTSRFKSPEKQAAVTKAVESPSPVVATAFNASTAEASKAPDMSNAQPQPETTPKQEKPTVRP